MSQRFLMSALKFCLYFFEKTYGLILSFVRKYDQV